ncbi:EGF-like domain protein [Trichinella nativa]|uniref:EGF-like domain protein n=1 Tax=Trichinella nativa TaxID=6335 RepID=A0A1Y3E3C5_9BILA|nr:EGF-like domain protein [Trichinella nativa]
MTICDHFWHIFHSFIFEFSKRLLVRLMLSGLLVGLIGAVEKCPSDIDKNLYNGYELRKGYCLTYLELDEEKMLLSEPPDDWFEFAKKECAEKLPNGTIHPAICTESSKLDIKYDYEFDNYDATALRGFKILSAHLIKAANSNETTLNVEIEFSNGTRLTVTEDTAQHLLCIKNRLKHILKRKDFPLCNDIEISIPPYAKHGTMSIVGSKIKSFFNCKNEHPYAFVLCASTYAYNCVEHVNKNYSQGCTECRPGFTGALCNHDTRVQANRRAYEGKIINESSDITVYEEQHIQCQNGATEFFLINRTVCNCPKGFTGKACEQSLKQRKTECYNGGTQVVLENHTDCACLSNFTGSHCQIRINQLNCTPGYHLSNTTGYEICICSKTNTTYSCLTVLKNYCKNKGIPVMRRSNVVNCECATNLSGERCEMNGKHAH